MRAPLKATVLLAVLVLASFSVASGQAVWVDMADVTGLTAEGLIPAGGTTLVVPIRYQNAGDPRTAISNGFDFLGDVNFTSLTGAWNPAYPWNWELAFPAGCYPPACYPFFDQGTFINYFTRGVGFAGLTGASGSGLPVGFDDIAVRVTLTGVAGPAGGTLVMDSTWWLPANFWLWSGVADNVSWGGPYTFTVEGGQTCTDPVITSTAVTAGQELVEYVYDVDATGDPIPTYALSVFPDGMVIDPISGIITWTPAEGQAGTHNVTVVATNDCENDATQMFQITVIPAYKVPVIAEITDKTASMGDDFEYDADIVQGFPIPTFSLVTGPAGMTVNPTSGLIEWTVNATGVFNVTIAATNIVGTDEESFTLTVSDCEPNTTCWPQPTVLKALENDRILNVIIHCEENSKVILSSIRVFNIPPYTGARIEGDSVVTDAFIMRFLGAGGMRPVPSEGYTDQDYPVYYDKTDGTSVELHGLFNLTMYVGDVTFDGVQNIDDVVFMTDYFFGKGPEASIWGETMMESMDVDQNERVDLLDVRALLELTGL